jgi:FHA domain/zinc-ribbon domain
VSRAPVAVPGEGGARVSHVYCPECGFQNPEAANYCSKCGARLIPESPGESTESFSPDELAEDPGGLLERGGPALVVRSGGGRAGETFFPKTTDVSLVGRSPECDIFLDDVTVSRKHAELSHEGERWTIRDLGSLNGTFVNRKRIEATDLEDDDEVQIGKYRLTFLLR